MYTFKVKFADADCQWCCVLACCAESSFVFPSYLEAVKVRVGHDPCEIKPLPQFPHGEGEKHATPETIEAGNLIHLKRMQVPVCD